MIIDQLDVAVRAGAAAALLLPAALLLRQWRRIGLPALLFAPLALCLTGFVLGNTPLALKPDGPVGAAARVLSGFTVIFLWWFCLSCFDRRFRVRGPVLAVGLIWGLIAALDRGLFGAALGQWEWSRLLLPLGFAIVGHLVWRLLVEREDDLIQQRHDARVLTAVGLGGMLFVDLSADLLFGFDWRPLAFALSQNLMILIFGLWLAGRLLTVRSEALTFGVANPERAPAEAPGLGARDAALHRRLIDLMENEQVFLDPELTFAAFVARMGASERAVRILINHELGHDHFRSFLNQYRVAEARRRLSAPAHAEDKLIAVALDSGFASLASFNRAFRAVEGCAPSRYRATARAASSTNAGSEEPKAGF